jgi:hypothetical protein
LRAKCRKSFAGCGIFNLLDAVQRALGFKPIWINEREEVLAIR